jgi:hypothetical protein
VTRRQYERSIRDDHLPFPQDFNKDKPSQKRLNRVFTDPDKPKIPRSARQAKKKGGEVRETSEQRLNRLLATLKKLREDFEIGGAPPRVVIRKETEDSTAIFVVKYFETGEQKTTGVPVDDMTVNDALKLEQVQRVFADFAADLLFLLQVQNAPATVRFKTIIRRYLQVRDVDKNIDPKKVETRILVNHSRNVRDPSKTTKKMASSAERMIKEFFHDRTLATHHWLLSEEIKQWMVEAALQKGAQLDVRGQPKGALDTNVASFVSVVRQSLSWLARRYRPQVRLDFETLKIDRGQSEPLMWSEARLLIHRSRGFVWENGGFAREWVWRDGDWHLEWKREDAMFRATYLPVMRHVLAYETAGIRLTCAKHMGWNPHFYRGYIDFDNREIVRTGSRAPNYENKPRETTDLIPFVETMFGTWRTRDMRQAAREKWPRPETTYMIHNGRGGPVWDIEDLVDDLCRDVGIESSNHKMKTACMTMLVDAGFDPFRAAELIGNSITSAITFYDARRKTRRGTRRRPPDEETMTFVDLVNPKKDLKPMPRAPIPPKPSAPPKGF